jgi:hypothetical protein
MKIEHPAIGSSELPLALSTGRHTTPGNAQLRGNSTAIPISAGRRLIAVFSQLSIAIRRDQVVRIRDPMSEIEQQARIDSCW